MSDSYLLYFNKGISGPYKPYKLDEGSRQIDVTREISITPSIKAEGGIGWVHYKEQFFLHNSFIIKDNGGTTIIGGVLKVTGQFGYQSDWSSTFSLVAGPIWSDPTIMNIQTGSISSPNGYGVVGYGVNAGVSINLKVTNCISIMAKATLTSLHVHASDLGSNNNSGINDVTNTTQEGGLHIGATFNFD